MDFRKATIEDLPEIMVIIQDAIESLRQQGSPQWQNGYGPSEEKIQHDIQENSLYVLSDGQILALAALIEGEDPVYTAIEEGQWQESAAYLSIHRVAVAKKATGRGIAQQLLRYLIEESKVRKISDIRIDTHELNRGMQKAILKTGFTYRGIVYFPIPDGKRLAYQYICE